LLLFSDDVQDAGSFIWHAARLHGDTEHTEFWPGKLLRNIRGYEDNIKWDLEVDETSSGSCPMTGFAITMFNLRFLLQQL
jgi:hypothetical protein